MTTTTHPEFNEKTEGLDVAKAFAGQVHGKTILVTGVNLKGIGFATAEAFASQSPAHLIIAGRSPDKSQESIDALKANYPNVDYRFLKLNLSSQADVRDAAKELLSWTDISAIDIVVNNAAISYLPQRIINADGIEMQFATNYIGPFLFTSLIMPKLISASKNNPKGATRIVNVSSGSPTVCAIRWSDLLFEKVNKDLPEAEQPPYHIHRLFGDPDPENKSYTPFEPYNQSKVGNLLFSVGANKRLYEKYGILSLTVHPGVIQTELVREAPQERKDAIAKANESGFFNYRSLGAGSATTVTAALDPKLTVPEDGERDGKENYGVFLMDCQISGAARKEAVGSAEAERLWKLAEEMVKEEFVW